MSAHEKQAANPRSSTRASWSSHDASRMLVMSVDDSAVDCATRLASVAEVRLTLRSAATPSDTSTQPK